MPDQPLPSQPIASTQKRSNRALQGMRGLAAVSVLLYHMNHFGAKAGLWPEGVTPVSEKVGVFSVCLFFCISGYLILTTLSRHSSVRRFFYNRFIRIYPVFLVLHLVMFGLGPWIGYEWMGELRNDMVAWVTHFTTNLFMLPGVLHLPLAQKNAWSLSYEALFYVVAASGYWSYRRWHSGVGRGIVVMVSAVLVGLWMRYLPECWFFGVGIAVWWIERRGWIDKLPVIGPLGIVCGAASYAGFVINVPLLAIALATLFFIDVVREKGWGMVLLQGRIMGFIGKISYSLYLMHPFVLEPMRRICIKLSPHIGVLNSQKVFLFAAPAAAVLVAWLSYEWIEVRLTRRMFPEQRAA